HPTIWQFRFLPPEKPILKSGFFTFPQKVLRPPDLAGKADEASAAAGFGFPATGQISQAEIAEPPRMQIVSGNNANRYTRQQQVWRWLFEDG
ncbi:MAG: hypothetical protein EBU59_06620, partial [Planctomycetia bacterium]|nr:hypothetical protein [Planctomycetia bacterium]